MVDVGNNGNVTDVLVHGAHAVLVFGKKKKVLSARGESKAEGAG